MLSGPSARSRFEGAALVRLGGDGAVFSPRMFWLVLASAPFRLLACGFRKPPAPRLIRATGVGKALAAKRAVCKSGAAWLVNRA